ncbi:PIN domain-containing protein [Candidatus Poribacteria bacterium]|nr:PIN domain-containing protein [Candidatus Poribacteria bacterium]
MVTISEALSDFEYIHLDESIWDEVGKFLYRLRKSGITVPFQDVVLCALALRHNLLLWTNDKHFALIKREIEDLRLFSYAS